MSGKSVGTCTTNRARSTPLSSVVNGIPGSSGFAERLSALLKQRGIG